MALVRYLLIDCLLIEFLLIDPPAMLLRTDDPDTDRPSTVPRRDARCCERVLARRPIVSLSNSAIERCLARSEPSAEGLPASRRGKGCPHSSGHVWVEIDARDVVLAVLAGEILPRNNAHHVSVVVHHAQVPQSELSEKSIYVPDGRVRVDHVGNWVAVMSQLHQTVALKVGQRITFGVRKARICTLEIVPRHGLYVLPPERTLGIGTASFPETQAHDRETQARGALRDALSMMPRSLRTGWPKRVRPITFVIGKPLWVLECNASRMRPARSVSRSETGSGDMISHARMLWYHSGGSQSRNGTSRRAMWMS